MTDHLSKDKRSWNMAKITAKNTSPEILVRKALFRKGKRFRLHDAKLPGKPDIVLSKSRKVIFVHGCFWHRHPGCSRASTPKSNEEYWLSKFQRNIERHKAVDKDLRACGWATYVIWECEAKNPDLLEAKIEEVLE